MGICTKVYARSEIFAKSQFWKTNREQHKLKTAAGEILRVNQVHEKNTRTVKAYGIYFHYRDNTCFRNAFKEFRATSLNSAMTQLFNEMASRQKTKRESIQIIKTCVMGSKDIKTRNPRVGRFSNSCGIKFPLWDQKILKLETQESEDSVTHAVSNSHYGTKESDTLIEDIIKRSQLLDQLHSRPVNQLTPN